ncbi:DUF6089 family protein [Mucilaginibacter sp. PAMB04168]|uniref:type IX secretion system protein PorG n=1 Tax=Mucilaginibacter sp. PAMB04168 TaxID=3138567 RepID=UPI0031F622B7
MRGLLTLVVLMMLGVCAKAQKWEIGVQAGAAGYQGDLNQRNPLQVSGLAAGILMRYNVNGYISIKASFTKAQIEGADSTSKYQQQRDRNLSFFTPMSELAVTGEFNFLKYLPGDGYNSFTPFIYAGIASTRYNPQATYQNETYELRPLRTEGQRAPYKNSTFAIPFGGGIKYNISGKLSLVADIGYRTAYTDRLDDVANLYTSPNAFRDPIALALSDRSGERNGGFNIGAPGTQRGDLRKHDTYMLYTIGISYIFLSQKCYYR